MFTNVTARLEWRDGRQIDATMVRHTLHTRAHSQRDDRSSRLVPLDQVADTHAPELDLE